MLLIAALYKFVALDELETLRARWLAEAERLEIKGSLLLATEGVNGTIAGEETALRRFLDILRADPRLADLSWKESRAETPPFLRMKVRLKREIVSMGAPEIVTPDRVGAYVRPEDWNALVRDPQVAVIDTRNAYETGIGRFAGAIAPVTERFRDFPAWARAWSERLTDESRPRAVAMYCTGGIRCEKATALMRQLGHEEVYHLEGGILAYLEHMPAEDSLWKGECFVFDERVSVGHGLAPGDLGLCRGCRRPVSEADRADPRYVEGVSCPACAEEATPEQRRARAERQRQVEIAETRGAAHLGREAMPEPPAPARQRRTG